MVSFTRLKGLAATCEIAVMAPCAFTVRETASAVPPYVPADAPLAGIMFSRVAPGLQQICVPGFVVAL